MVGKYRQINLKLRLTSTLNYNFIGHIDGVSHVFLK